MPSLAQTGDRFEIPLTVIEGGSGVFHGVLIDTSQNTQTATVFSDPRRLMRVRNPSAVQPGMVIRTPLGEVFIVANNGGSELPEGPVWKSFKLFKATQQVRWKRRGRTTDPVTLLEIEGERIPLQSEDALGIESEFPLSEEFVGMQMCDPERPAGRSRRCDHPDPRAHPANPRLSRQRDIDRDDDGADRHDPLRPSPAAGARFGRC